MHASEENWADKFCPPATPRLLLKFSGGVSNVVDDAVELFFDGCQVYIGPFRDAVERMDNLGLRVGDVWQFEPDRSKRVTLRFRTREERAAGISPTIEVKPLNTDTGQ